MEGGRVLIKLVAIDLDDTLLRTDCTISPGAKAAIEKAIARGVVVTFATGRMYLSARPFAQQLGLDVPLITYQGALIKSALLGEVFWHKPVPSNVAQEILAKADEWSLQANIYLDDQLYVKEDNESIRAYSDLAKVPYIIEKGIFDRVKADSLEPTKILLIGEPKRLDQIWEENKEGLGRKVQIVKSKDHFLEFTNLNATKGKALSALAEKLDIPIEATMAIGDSYNDIDMLIQSGVGVAMGNAKAAVKEVADYVTLRHDDDGVAEAITRFILK